MFGRNFGYLRMIFVVLILASAVYAEDASETGELDISKPSETECGNGTGIVSFTCNIMLTLLTLGPLIAVIAIVLGGIVYVYASVFVTADQRGRYHTLATNLALGGIILLALVGGVGYIVTAGKGLLVTESTG